MQGLNIVEAALIEKFQSNAVEKYNGVMRMQKSWREKLWMENDRDKNNSDEMQVLDLDEPEALEDVEELRLDKHTATVEHLQHLYEHISQNKTKRRLLKLEISKLLFTAPKAKILADTLSHPNCRIVELTLDKCRAKSEKMVLLFGALARNQSVKNLVFQDTSIPRDSVVALADLLGANIQLNMLTLFNAGLSDSNMLNLAPGLAQSHGLIYLDIRQNTFENEGFQALAKSLTGHKSLMTLRINGMYFNKEETSLLKQLFSHPACHIQNLEMEELEVADDKTDEVFEAVGQVKQLFTFDFSNNHLSHQMISSVVCCLQKYPQLEILCLDHCEMTDLLCNQVFQHLNSTKLQFLNLSWNLLTPECIDMVADVLQKNQDLEKLCLQHNSFGEGDMSYFAEVLSGHQALTYLDVSANKIQNNNFKKLFEAVQSSSSLIKTFHCRKNMVGGQQIQEVLKNCHSTNIRLIDLTANKLTDKNSKVLLDYAKRNVGIESIILEKNLLVNSQIMKDIGDECLQNILIKQKVLTSLQPSQGAVSRTRQRQYHQYDVSSLCIENQRLEVFDFIQKFVKQNMLECHKLMLRNLHLHNSQNQIMYLFQKQNFSLGLLKVLHIEDSEQQQTQLTTMITAKVMRKLIYCLKSMLALEELHLVNLTELEPQMLSLGKSLEKHNNLRVLDLRQNYMRKRDVSALVPLVTSIGCLEELNISQAIISKKNMQHLWLALHFNVSICKLTYSRLNFLAINEIKAIDSELNLNEIIRDQVKPKFASQMKVIDKKIPDLSLRGFNIPPQINPAVIKYLKTLDSLQTLDLSKTGLRQSDILTFVVGISERSLKLKTLKLSDNESVDDSVAENLSHLFKNQSTLRHLYLDQTRITLYGVKLLLNSIKESLKVGTISTKGCGIDFKGMNGQSVIQIINQNISLTSFGYENNEVDTEFAMGVSKEMELNADIVKTIIPQLIYQEIDAREQAFKDNKQKNINDKNQDSSKAKQISGANNGRQSVTPALLKSATGKKMFKTEVHNSKSAKTRQKRRCNSFDSLQGSLSITDPGKLSLQGPAHSSGPTRRMSMKIGSYDHSKTLISPAGTLGLQVHQTKGKSLDNLSSKYQDSCLGSNSDSSSSDSSSQSSSEEAEDPSMVRHFTLAVIANKRDISILNKGGFKLKLDSGLAPGGIEYVTKFTRVFREIQAVDFGDNKLDADQLEKFGNTLQLNKYIKAVVYKKKGISKNQEKLLNAEIEKNNAISDVGQALRNNYDQGAQKLDLADQNLKKLNFLPKMIQEFSNLQSLDLSNSDLRTNDSVVQLCKMIDENDSIKTLTLRHCNMNGNSLSIIADALTKLTNSNLRELDIRDNPIQDPQYKVLFGLLQNNHTIQKIDYTLYDEENNKKLEKFKILTAQGLSKLHISQKLEHDEHELHHKPIPLWQKIVFPIWCWKSLIHDKHEAFRFKYDTAQMQKLEHDIMPGVKIQLYLWTLVYYFIVFAAPYIFIIHACEETFEVTLFILFAIYMVLSGVWEIYVVIKIQKTLNDDKLLKFNKWHFVELIMGSIARTDTFLDICFVHIIANCWDQYEFYVIPSMSFAILNFLFPAFMLLRLLKSNFGNALTQPLIESTCFVSFIRETMLLATVLDSFCINNSFYFLNYPLVFGKLMGFISFFTQDFPQLTIHVLFKTLIISEAQYQLKSQKLLLIGMCVSCFACLISIFNMVMCTQNEFDPIVLEQELSSRQQKEIKQQQDILQQERLNQRRKSKIEVSRFIAKTQIEIQKFDKNSEDGSEDKSSQPEETFMSKIQKEFQKQNDQNRETTDKIQSHMKYMDEGTNPGGSERKQKYNTIVPESIIPEKPELKDSASSNDDADDLFESNYKSNHNLIERDGFNSSQVIPLIANVDASDNLQETAKVGQLTNISNSYQTTTIVNMHQNTKEDDDEAVSFNENEDSSIVVKQGHRPEEDQVKDALFAETRNSPRNLPDTAIGWQPDTKVNPFTITGETAMAEEQKNGITNSTQGIEARVNNNLSQTSVCNLTGQVEDQ